MRISVKLAPTFSYPELERFWRAADRLGFEAVWNYDHFYGLVDNATPTLEGWTTLAAMGVVVRRARVGCMVTGVTYRNPAILAKMAVTVDHISGGRMDFGILPEQFSGTVALQRGQRELPSGAPVAGPNAAGLGQQLLPAHGLHPVGNHPRSQPQRGVGARGLGRRSALRQSGNDWIGRTLLD